jgi:hypothetical protein
LAIFQSAAEKSGVFEGTTRTKSGLLIPKSLAPKAEEVKKPGHLENEKTTQQEPSTVAGQEAVEGNTEEEYDDMPALEEPDFALDPGSSDVIEEPLSEPCDSIVQPVTKEDSEIIEVNVSSGEPSSIFGKQKLTKKSSDIFADLVSDSDESDNENENDKDESTEQFIIEQRSSSNNVKEVSATSSRGNKLLIEEIQSPSTKETSTSSKPKIETLSAPSHPKKNPFLITEVHSSDISEMFSKQDDLLHDDVEQMYVGDAHDEAQSSVRVQTPGSDSFLSKIGQTIDKNNKNQSKCVSSYILIMLISIHLISSCTVYCRVYCLG